MNHLSLSWTDFDLAVSILADCFSDSTFTGVYGFPRGGLPLAVALSHRLDLPLLPSLSPGCLAVDDICDSGRTLLSALDRQPAAFAVWVVKTRPLHLPLTAVISDSTDRWILFPWELPSNAINDQQLYLASRQ